MVWELGEDTGLNVGTSYVPALVKVDPDKFALGYNRWNVTFILSQYTYHTHTHGTCTHAHMHTQTINTHTHKHTHTHIQTHKSRGVVILDSLGVSKGLQDWVSLEQLSLQLSLASGVTRLGHQRLASPLHQGLLGGLLCVGVAMAVAVAVGASDGGKVLDHLLGVLSLTGTGLSTVCVCVCVCMCVCTRVYVFFVCVYV